MENRIFQVFFDSTRLNRVTSYRIILLSLKYTGYSICGFIHGIFYRSSIEEKDRLDPRNDCCKPRNTPLDKDEKQ